MTNSQEPRNFAAMSKTGPLKRNGSLELGTKSDYHSLTAVIADIVSRQHFPITRTSNINSKFDDSLAIIINQII